MPTTYKEYIPENAEIVVDYRRPKERRVSFSYPVKRTFKESIGHTGYRTFFNHWLILNIFVLTRVMIPFALSYVATSFLLMLLVHPALAVAHIQASMQPTYHSQLVYDPMEGQLTSQELLQICFMILGGFLWLFEVPTLASKFAARNKELFAHMIPLLNYETSKYLGNIKYAKISSSDIHSKMYIIPIFSNVYLEWKPTGDFNRYLERIEVLNIPNDYYIMRSMKKAPVDEYRFRAAFYFSRTPKNGEMELIFD